MAGSVKLRTAIPTLAEFGTSLGLKKADQQQLISFVRRDVENGRFTVVRSTRTAGTKSTSAKSFALKKTAKKTSALKNETQKGVTSKKAARAASASR